MKIIYFTLTLLVSFNISAQQKEVLIIGTMHTVPELVKKSYEPLLKYSKAYNPEAIYTEYVMPNDTVSLLYDTPEFVATSDSIKKIFTTDTKRFEKLMSTNLSQFSQEDFEFTANTYLAKRDNANYTYFLYLSKYGIEGSLKPLRHENADLTAKLAIVLNLTYLHSMDDQQTNEAYHKAWKDCNEDGVNNGDNDINQDLGKKQYTSAIIPALAGRFGKHTNKMESLKRLHLLSSFRYVQNPSPACDDATQYWDERNYRMAVNIAEQIIQESSIKNIVFVGAAHVIGITEALNQYYPEIEVKLMND